MCTLIYIYYELMFRQEFRGEFAGLSGSLFDRLVSREGSEIFHCYILDIHNRQDLTAPLTSTQSLELDEYKGIQYMQGIFQEIYEHTVYSLYELYDRRSSPLSVTGLYEIVLFSAGIQDGQQLKFLFMYRHRVMQVLSESSEAVEGQVLVNFLTLTCQDKSAAFFSRLAEIDVTRRYSLPESEQVIFSFLQEESASSQMKRVCSVW